MGTRELAMVFAVSAFVLMSIAISGSTSVSSINWAGYISVSNTANIMNNSVKMVNGTWIVQNVTQTTNPVGYSSQWVGIDGYTNQYLIQTGTESDSSNNVYNNSYYAWWEILPSAETFIPNFIVRPGDIMYAKIVLLNATSHTWSIELQDITRNETFNNTVQYNNSESSAEWIDERTYVGVFPPLADFRISYYGSNYTKIPKTDYAEIKGTLESINSSQHIQVDLTNLSRTGIEASPSNLNHNSSFKVSIAFNASISQSTSGIDSGYSANFTAVPFGGIPPFTYQWFQKAPGSQSYSKTSDTSSNYLIATNAQTQTGTWSIAVNVVEGIGNTVSVTSQLAVNKPPSFNSQLHASTQAADIGQNVTITDANSPVYGTAPYSYVWYEEGPGNSTYAPINGSSPLQFYNATQYPNPYGYGVYSTSCQSANHSIYCAAGVTSPWENVTTYGLANWNSILWKYTTQYPIATFWHNCVLDNSTDYCIGGMSENTSTYGVYASSNTYYSQISPSGIGSWVKTTPYPVGVYLQSCASYNNYVYCVGGVNESGITHNYTYYARLTPSGIGSWKQTTSYPYDVQSESCVANNGYIYCIGGLPYGTSFFPLSNQTYYAQVNSSGVGKWKQTTTLPTRVESEQCAVNANTVYCTSGVNMNGFSNQSYYAQLSSNGIGSWTESEPYPIRLYENSCTVSNGHLYCIGGCNGNAYVSGRIVDLTCDNPVRSVYVEKLLPLQYIFSTNNLTKVGTYNIMLSAKDSGQFPQLNSSIVSIKINQDPAVSVTESNQSGALETITAQINGGTAPFAYNFTVRDSANGTVAATLLANSNQSMYSDSPVLPVGNYIVEVSIKDNSEMSASAYNAFAITSNIPLQIPTISPSKPTTYEIGQTINISAQETGGVPPYTYNFLFFNNTNVIVANQLGQSNIFLLPANASMVGNTYNANVIVTDNTQSVENSTFSGAITIVQVQTTTTTSSTSSSSTTTSTSTSTSSSSTSTSISTSTSTSTSSTTSKSTTSKSTTTTIKPTTSTTKSTTSTSSSTSKSTTSTSKRTTSTTIRSTTIRATTTIRH